MSHIRFICAIYNDFYLMAPNIGNIFPKNMSQMKNTKRGNPIAPCMITSGVA